MPTKTNFSSFFRHVPFRSPGLIAAAACCLVVTLAFAGKPVPPPTVNVTSIVYDQDTSGKNLLFQGDDVNRTSEAIYTNTGNVTTSVGNPGGWRLDLYNQVTRTVCLTFSTVDGSAPVVPNGCYSANVEIYSRCFDPLNGSEIGFLTIEVGNPQGNCTFGFDFNPGRTKYKLEMGQSLQSTPAGGPTGLATVTCNASNGSTCVSWTIAPNTSALNPTIANLYAFGHAGSLQYIGQYYLTYRIDVTYP